MIQGKYDNYDLETGNWLLDKPFLQLDWLKNWFIDTILIYHIWV